jgi:hypothetical protein
MNKEITFMTSQVKKYFPLVSQDKFYLEINNALKLLEQLHKKILDKASLLNQTTDDYTVPDNILLVRPAEKKTLYSTIISSVSGPGSALVNYKMYGVGFLGSYFNYSAISKTRKNLKQGSITLKLFKEITLQNTDTKSHKEECNSPLFTMCLNLNLITHKSTNETFEGCIIDLQEIEYLIKNSELLFNIGYNKDSNLSFNTEYWINDLTADLILGVYQKFLEVSNSLVECTEDFTNKFSEETTELNDNTINQLSIYSDYSRDLTIESEVSYRVPLGAVILKPNTEHLNSKLKPIIKRLHDICIRATQFLSFLNYESEEAKTKIFDVLDKCKSNLDHANSLLETANRLSSAKNIVKIDNVLAEALKPKVEEFLNKVRNTKSQIFYLNTWNYNPPNKMVFESNIEMYDKVMEHCADIPGFRITYLRKVELLYMSDGEMEYTPHAINHPKYSNKVVEIYENEYGIRDHRVVDRDANIPIYNTLTVPVIYLGEAWLIKFLVFNRDLLRDCRVYFATPEQFYKAYENTRPDLLEGFEPFSDLMTITSDWCSRNDPTATYGAGIDLYSPWSQRQSLKAWILGPAIAKNMTDLSFKVKSVTKVRNFNGYYERDRLHVIEKKLNKALTS